MRAVLGLLPLVLVAAACAPPSTPPPSGGVGTSINPVWTDPATTADPVFTHLAYPPTTAARGRLAVMLHGTGSNPQGHYEIANALRSDGYHVIVLRYNAPVSTLGACPDADVGVYPTCHTDLRGEIVFGAGVTDPLGGTHDHSMITVTQPNSVMNRLLKLVEYLVANTSGIGWEGFQQLSGPTCTSFNATYGACDLDWSKVAMLGHSQGGSVALYLAKFFALDRVGMMSGSYDAWDLGGSFQAASWITSGAWQVPVADIATLTHGNDYGLGRIREVEDSIGVPGPEVAASPGPFTSNRLFTTTTPSCWWDSTPGHNSTAVDACAPDYLYWDAWRYLAGS